MPKLRIMTFNIENLLVRFDFKGSDQGLASLLDVDSEMDRANLIRTHWNVINDENRVFTALSIKEGSPDVICLQEVDSFQALKSFYDKYISSAGTYLSRISPSALGGDVPEDHDCHGLSDKPETPDCR
jgi:hypothetical protein